MPRDIDEFELDELKDVEEIEGDFKLSKVTIENIIKEAIQRASKYKTKDGTYLSIGQAEEGIENHEFDEIFEMSVNEIIDEVIEQVMTDWNNR